MSLRWNGKVDPSDANTDFNGPIRGERLLSLIRRGYLIERVVQLFWDRRDQHISQRHRLLFTAGGIVRHLSGSDAGRKPNGWGERNPLRAHGRRRAGKNRAADNEEDEGCYATAAS